MTVVTTRIYSFKYIFGIFNVYIRTSSSLFHYCARHEGIRTELNAYAEGEYRENTKGILRRTIIDCTKGRGSKYVDNSLLNRNVDLSIH